MSQIYNDILEAKKQERKLLAVLLDPDKISWNGTNFLVEKITESPATHLLVGGSTVKNGDTEKLVAILKEKTALPVVLFPGHPSQIAANADGILLLSLLSGRNSDYLIGHHVAAAPILKKTNLEIIPTGYLLIESGGETAVARVSQTQPLPVSNPGYIVNTAVAAEMLGKEMVYLEAGSGAKNPVPPNIIKQVSKNIQIPLIVGGGIRSKAGIEETFAAGADMVVIGTAFEDNLHFFK
jgi:putative glycerol-1-phosphate prenyltransferase